MVSLVLAVLACTRRDEGPPAVDTGTVALDTGFPFGDAPPCNRGEVCYFAGYDGQLLLQVDPTSVAGLVGTESPSRLSRSGGLVLGATDQVLSLLQVAADRDPFGSSARAAIGRIEPPVTTVVSAFDWCYPVCTVTRASLTDDAYVVGTADGLDLSTLRSIDRTTGAMTILAGGVAAPALAVGQPAAGHRFPSAQTILPFEGGLVVNTDEALVFLDEAGIVSRMLLTNFEVASSPDVTALDALLWAGGSISLSPGILWLSDSSRNLIWRVDTATWIATRAAGVFEAIPGAENNPFFMGVDAHSGDGGPAVDARLGGLGALAATPIGSLYFWDTRGTCIRRIGPDGIIDRAAGTCTFDTVYPTEFVPGPAPDVILDGGDLALVGDSLYFSLDRIDRFWLPEL